MTDQSSNKAHGSKKAWLSAGPVAVMLLAMPCSVMAANKDELPDTPPALFTDLVACKAITEPEKRLACYDDKVTALEAAQTSKQLVIADREQIREARRGLFGLSLPRIKLFGSDSEDEGVSEINSTIKSARQIGYGEWKIILEDDARWVQIDQKRVLPRPKSGDDIQIKKGALGSYVAKINGGRAFKVRRIVE